MTNFIGIANVFACFPAGANISSPIITKCSKPMIPDNKRMMNSIDTSLTPINVIIFSSKKMNLIRYPLYSSFPFFQSKRLTVSQSSRGESQLTFRPLTPPYVRTRIRRFNKLSVRTGTSRRCPHILEVPVLCLLMIDEEYDFWRLTKYLFLYLTIHTLSLYRSLNESDFSFWFLILPLFPNILSDSSLQPTV